MEWIVDKPYLISLLVCLISSIITFVVSKLTGGKQTTVLKVLNAINNSLPEIIAMAEKIGATGEERKKYAMSQVGILAQAMGITATEEQLNAFSKSIDNLVALTKSINNKVQATAIKTLEVNNGN